MIRIFLLLFASVAIALSSVQPVEALAGWNAGRIIDDAIFANKNSMSVTQIQAFLNSKVPTCDTNGQQLSEFGGPDLNSDGKVQRWEYGQSKYGQSTFPCLRNYTEAGRTAAQIIYDTSQQYTINPQVFIVLLQKEQGLITDTWPLNVQYRTATGYGCPDTAPCDSQYYGLSNQLNWSGKMFRAILNNSPTWYTPYILGNNYIQYSPTKSCGGSTVNIQNRATQALYNYTPYQPNQAALDAGYGTVHCGAYGNRNFFLYFRDWFGPPTGVSYSWNVSSYGLYSDPARTQRIDVEGGAYATPGQKIYARVKAQNTGVSIWSHSNLKIGTLTANSPLHDNSWVYLDRAAYLSESSVGYDGIGTFDFTLTTPATVGNYYQKFNLVIDGVTWFNEPGMTFLVKSVNPSGSPTASTSANKLASDATLTPGQTIFSSDRNSALRFENGQVSFYSNMRLVWSTGTAGSGATRFVNQSDGNLVLYNANYQALWASNTGGNGPSELRLQSDGNLVLYNASNNPLWATDTRSPADETVRVIDMLGFNGALFRGQQAMSLDRKYKLTLQDDGNLVLYGPTKVLWATGTDGKNGDRLVVQSDGNMVLYSTSGKPLWASHSDGRGLPVLIIQQDGNLVLYGRGVSWASNTSQ